MTDKELLELAAKAAGLKLDGPSGRIVRRESDGQPVYWNPLTDNDDALRLAVRCAQLSGFYRFLRARLIAMTTEQGGPSDPLAATRRAIVRAAAEIGRQMT